MKIELELTEEELDLLKSLVFSKYRELDKEDEDLLVGLAFSEEKDVKAYYERQIIKFKTPFKNAKNLYDQVKKYNYPDM